MNTKTLIISNLTVYKENETYESGYVKIKDEQIIEIGPMANYEFNSLDEVIMFSPDYSLIPGFIDLHIHGLNGSDIMDNNLKSLSTIAQTLPKEGTTSFLATTITQSTENIEAALTNISTYQSSNPEAEILGIHLEGPFISSLRAGAQPIPYIKKPDIELFDRWQMLSGNMIKLVTLAPESETGLAFVSHLTKSGVIASIGHSDATYTQVQDAIDQGLSHVTHLYNGMRGFHHREPGVAGAALSNKQLMVEMIVDGIHIHPAIVNSTYRAKKAEEIILITDSMRAKGLSDGVYDLGGQQVNVSNGKALLQDGTLAGSILTMNQAVKNMISFTGCTLEEITVMASKNPAKQIGVWNQKGSISVGKEADMVILDKDFNIVLTLCKGKISFIK
ncbi:N-acetylglucosamine-6-phosphate deacetylase [Bacillus solitudinis]|uniref:N-acetylglucosamine-6-phosphate deacetylase n=1 Tax=Bacillus solitudinis TaxID=2014074 RepID=UPI000C23D7A1|nr:N-acetylglucosamine-6-phosphate deacetylase [Bacillus solitudinis]